MIQVSDHVWAHVDYDGANVGCVVGDRGVLLVESPMCPADARDWLAKVHAVTDAPILHVVTTDHHFDHSVCSGMLCESLVMHERAAAAFDAEVKGHVLDLFRTYYPDRIAEAEADLPTLESASPGITFSQRMAIDLGGVRAELIHTGGHAEGTSLLHVVPDRVVFPGDNVTYGRHAYMGEMCFSRWLAALGTTIALGPSVVVPGHGGLCGIDGVCKMHGFFLRMGEQVARGLAAGLDEDAVAAESDDLVGYFPLLPGREAMTREWVDVALRLTYREMAASACLESRL